MQNSNQQSGFTLIEMIVSLAIFSVVATITVGAMLILIGTNQRLQVEQNVMTNLSFALDSMTREIRTGTGYYCQSRPNYNAGGANVNIFNDNSSNTGHEDLADSTQSCDTGRTGPNGVNGSGQTEGHRLQGISVIEGGDSITGALQERILYFYDSGRGDDDIGRIYRRVGNGVNQVITSDNVDIQDMQFYVTGTEPGTAADGGDDDQSMVTIYLEAIDRTQETEEVFRIQTTVTMRTLDII